MRAAEELGFAGFGGACWSAAVAINRLLFSSRAGYIMGVNAVLHAAGCTLGHVAVSLAGEADEVVYLDADGRAKSIEEIESWGMLDPQDDDWSERAAELGVEWSEAAAEGAAVLPVAEEDLLAYAQPGLLQRQLSILEEAITRTQPSALAASSLRPSSW